MKPETEFEPLPQFWAIEEMTRIREDRAFMLGAIVGAIGAVAVAIILAAL